jgi:hypothetical protein
MNNSQLYIENVALGLRNVSNLEKLDMDLNEYLIVGERTNNNINNTIDNQYNFIINNNGVAVNASRRELRDTNAGFYINNNIICKGSIVAKSFQVDNFVFDSSITSQKLDTLIKSVNSNLLFFNGYYNSNSLIKNIYTPNYVTIGSFSSTYSNAHPLKIIDNPNGRSENLQLGIYNNNNNDIEATRFAIGMMGFNQQSPILMTTTSDMPLEFHISKTSSQMNKLYENGTGLPYYNESNYPNLAIDINGCININKDKCETTIIHKDIIRNPILNVNGYGIISNLCVYDYYSSQNLHLDDIYIRKQGLTLKANQIIGGDFAEQEFIFNSNIYIGKSNNFYQLNVNGDTNIIRTLKTNNLIANNTIINGITNFNKNTYFNNTTIFNDNISVDKSLNINNDLFIGGYRVQTSNLDFSSNGLNYDYNCNLNISGRFGTGILNTDSYDHQFNIIKRNKERFELYIQDYAGITNDSSKVYMGHTYLNDINGGVDNSFIILTQKNIRWHNIYFYAGKDKDGTKGIKNLIPNLAIMENNRIGINTNLPEKTLDVIGEIITNDYFIKRNNINLKLNFIYFGDNNNSILNVNNFDINLKKGITYNNKKTLNLTGGINSYDGYFENNYKLASFKFYNSSIATTYNNIGIGIIEPNNYYSIPLQIRNTNTNDNNNSVIRLYRGVKGGGFNNNSLYTGIDFCDYDMPIISQNRNNYKWFIYKNNNHNKETTGPLQIGYTDNSYNPTHSCMNFYYNKDNKKYFIDINNPNINYNYNSDNIISVKGNIEIDGNINLIGANSCYKINGVIVGSFSNPAVLTAISDTINTYTTDNINDVSLIGNKILLIPKKTTVIGYNDNWIFTKINSLELFDNNTPLYIYNNKDYTDNNEPPVVTRFYNKSYKNYTSRPDIAIIELGILTDNSDEGTVNNKVNFVVKGYTQDITIFEIKPNNNEPFLTCISQNSKNQINVGNSIFYNSNNINFNDTCFHISDDFDCLLRLTNNTKASKLSFINNINRWDITASSNFNFNFNNNSLFELSSSGIITINSRDNNNNSSFNINAYINKPSIELTNSYYNDYETNQNDFNTNSWININYNLINIENENIHQDNYDDNFDSNISKFIYKINDSNLPIIDYNNSNINNYYINNSNFSFAYNSIISLNTTLNNIELDYKFLDSVNVYTSSNTIELIPTLKCTNNNISVNIKTFNIITVSYNLTDNELLINYKVPLTIDENQLYIESTISSLAYYSNFDINNYYNLSLNTFLKVKDKPLFDYNIKVVNSLFTVNNNGINYHYNTNNIIYYYPIPNINISDLEVNINYIYNYENSFIIPKNFYNNNYTNFIDINTNDTSIIINNSNSFLTDFIEGSSIVNQFDATNFKSYKLISSNIINKIYTLEINDVIIKDVIININKNNYYEVYDFNLINPIIQLPITANLFQPHIIFKNYINSSYSSSHKFYSYNNNFEIHLDNTKLLSLDDNGTINTNGNININNIYFSGDIYSKVDDTYVSITSNLTHIIGSNFYIHKDNISLNSSNIYLNPSYINGGGVIINGSDINTTNNLFEINNYIGNDNFITLNSISSSSYINFFNTTSRFRVGVNDGNFSIYKSIDNNNYNNVINLNYDINNNLNIDINGHINTTNDFSINNITTYITDDNNYRLRVYGNLKVDGVVMSSSDKRLKNNINKIDNALDKIEKLSGVFYYYNNNDIHRQMGLIAQDVKEVIPEVVYEDEKGYLNIAYGNLMGVVIEAIKELRNEIKNIK